MASLLCPSPTFHLSSEQWLLSVSLWVGTQGGLCCLDLSSEYTGDSDGNRRAEADCSDWAWGAETKDPLGLVVPCVPRCFPCPGRQMSLSHPLDRRRKSSPGKLFVLGLGSATGSGNPNNTCLTRVDFFMHHSRPQLGGLSPQKASSSSVLWPHYSQGPAGHHCGRTSRDWATCFCIHPVART